MELFDTHCHLPSLTHISVPEALASAEAAKVTSFICIGATDKLLGASQAVALAEHYETVWASVGIHPHDASSEADIATLEPLLRHPKVVAVGETGLDFYREWSPFPEQQRVFEQTIAIARRVQKPLIIHCRDAAEATLETLLRTDAQSVGGVFHCYSEDARFAQRLKEINFLVSFTGSLTFKRADALREAAREIPLEQIMLETDCPYMAPEPFRGKPSEPKHVLQIAECVAEVKGISVEEVARVTTENAKRLFRIP